MVPNYGGRCDRILWYGKGVKQLQYLRAESKFSDHCPVSALFSTQIEIRSSSTGLVAFHNNPKSILLTKHVSSMLFNASDFNQRKFILKIDQQIMAYGNPILTL